MRSRSSFLFVTMRSFFCSPTTQGTIQSHEAVQYLSAWRQE